MKAESTLFFVRLPSYPEAAGSIQIYAYYWYKGYINPQSAEITD